MKQVREVMTVNEEMGDESSWVWLIIGWSRWGFLYGQNLR